MDCLIVVASTNPIVVVQKRGRIRLLPTENCSSVIKAPSLPTMSRQNDLMQLATSLVALAEMLDAVENPLSRSDQRT